MKRLAIIAAALALAGCWDMTAEEWQYADEQCKPFGGVLAADSTRAGSNIEIQSLCADRRRVTAVYKSKR